MAGSDFNELVEGLLAEARVLIEQRLQTLRLETGRQSLARLRSLERRLERDDERLAALETPARQAKQALGAARQQFSKALHERVAALDLDSTTSESGQTLGDETERALSLVRDEIERALGPLIDEAERTQQALEEARSERAALEAELRALRDAPEVVLALGEEARQRREAHEAALIQAKVQDLAGTLGQPRWDHAPAAAYAGPYALLERLGPPEALDRTTARQQLALLEREVAAKERWAPWPSAEKRAVLWVVAARLRRLQEALEPGAEEARLTPLFGALSTFSKTHELGYVEALKRGDAPPGGLSWLDHERRWWRKLHGDPTPAANGARPSRNGRRRESSPAPRAAGAAPEPRADVPPADWPHRARLSGRRAVLVGGDLAPPALEEVRAAFGFREVDWLSGLEPRQVDALRASIRHRGVDLVVLVTDFLNHRTSKVVKKACKSAKVGLVLTGGYTVAALRQAFERQAAHLPSS